MVSINSERRIDVPHELLAKFLSAEQQAEAQENNLHVMSVTVTAVKSGR